MRMEFSNLNYHLYTKGCVNNPSCSCSNTAETVHHYFFECIKYASIHENFISELESVLPPNTRITDELVLYGLSNYDDQCNVRIFHLIFDFIRQTTRF